MTRVASAGTVVFALLAAGPAAALGICVEGDYPPFSQVQDDGTIVGFDIDIDNALCAEIGETCDLVRTRWERMIPTLTGGRCDAIVASMSDTEERREQIDFTDVYYRTPARFVAAAGTGLGDAPDDLAGLVVGVQRGTTNETFMDAHYPATTLRLYGNQEHVLLDLTLGRLDAVLGEARQLDGGFLETPAGEGFAFFGGPHFDPAIQGEGAAVGVRKADTDLRDRLSAAIAAIRADGTYAEISDRWFGEDIYEG
jgi:polar amino acid transport system substrate-binding protein/arginine/ornithine transport system substrate-binding protein